MGKFIFIFIAVLEILKIANCLPYRGIVFPKDDDNGKNARAELNNYNFEEESNNNCDNDNYYDNHHHTNDAASFQHDPEFHRRLNLQQHSNNFQHNPQYHQSHQIPQDIHHSPEYNYNQDINVEGSNGRRNTRTDDAPNDNSLSPVSNVDPLIAQRTILDAPTNCKQRNFKGRCIKY